MVLGWVREGRGGKDKYIMDLFSVFDFGWGGLYHYCVYVYIYLYINKCIYIYIYMLPPPEKSTVFMGVVRANSRKIFEVEHKFSQNNCFC